MLRQIVFSALVLMSSPIFAKTMLVYSGGNHSCFFKSPKSLLVKKELLPIKKEYDLVKHEELGVYLSCFSKGDLYVWDNLDKKTTKIESARFPKEDFYRKSQDFDKIVFVGHSWGSWMQLDFLSQERFHEYKDYSVISIDAVSKHLCRYKGPWLGCREFPVDIDQREIGGFWSNYYQLWDYIRSGAAIGADRNTKIKKAHSVNRSSSKAWREVRQKVMFD